MKKFERHLEFVSPRDYIEEEFSNKKAQNWPKLIAWLKVQNFILRGLGRRKKGQIMVQLWGAIITFVLASLQFVFKISQERRDAKFKVMETRRRKIINYFLGLNWLSGRWAWHTASFYIVVAMETTCLVFIVHNRFIYCSEVPGLDGVDLRWR